ncbi:TonB-dependent receptor [Sphingosinithalassobacter portus]|uniref:TonB-dependent receptor n=1 Tax=Stakelama portus TaxID=2676234 RepID=UPI000D6EA368|nr:TonB-dependent receptor [Sphingosinithalassobacter portus]
MPEPAKIGAEKGTIMHVSGWMTAAVLSIFVAAPLHAQQQGDSAETDAETILVSATGRRAYLEHSPDAATVLNSPMLGASGVTDLRDVERLTPSLQATSGQSAATGTAFAIRGATTAGDNPGFEPAVGIYIDGVLRSRAGMALGDLPPLDRVEVLRGPQGTLFGRNATAGAIAVFTAPPEFRWRGYGEAQLGNYGLFALHAGATGPVGDTLALRLDGGLRRRDGYISDANSRRTINDLDRWNVRGQALFDSGNIRFRLIGDYAETQEQCCGVAIVSRGAFAPAIDAIAAGQGLVGIHDGPAQDRVQGVSPMRDYGERVGDGGISGQLDWELGAATLTSVTAWRDWRVTRNQDIDYSGIDRAYRDGFTSDVRDFTQEVRLRGSTAGGGLDWLIGGFFLDQRLRETDTVRLGRDGDRYVDAVLAGQLGAPPPQGIGIPAQFYGSYAVPTLTEVGAALQGLAPLPPGAVPLFGQLLYLQSPTLQAAAPPGSALFDYLNSPLAGSAAGQGNQDDRYRVDTRAVALFTHDIVHLTDQLSLTLGLRWDHETKRMTARIANDTGGCAFFTDADPRAALYRQAIRAADPDLYEGLFLLACNPAVNTEFNGDYADRRSDARLSGTVRIAWQADPRLLLYAGFSRGVKSGGYNLDQSGFDTAVLGGNGAQASDLGFGPEHADAWEVGIKFSPSPAIMVNLAGYVMDIHDAQALAFGGTSFSVLNVDSETAKGVEAEAILRPVPAVSLRLGYAWMDIRYDDENDFSGTPLTGLEGARVLNQPPHVVTIAASWSPPLGATMHALVHVDTRYQSAVEIDGYDRFTGRGVVRNPAYALVNARIGIGRDDGRWSVSLFVENLFDTYYHVTGLAIPEQPGAYAGFPGPPRFWGIALRSEFMGSRP